MSETNAGLTVEQPTWGGQPAESERRIRTRSRIPALTILFHPEVSRIGERVILHALMEGRIAPPSRLEPVFEVPYKAGLRPLADRHLSRSPLRLLRTEEGAVQISIGESRTRVVADGSPIQENWTFSHQEIERGIV